MKTKRSLDDEVSEPWEKSSRRRSASSGSAHLSEQPVLRLGGLDLQTLADFIGTDLYQRVANPELLLK